MNRKAFNRINYGLFIVAATADGKRNGCIVNSLHQVTSSSPYKFSLTVNKSNETFKTIEAAGSFAATVLAKDTPKDLVDLFGYKSGRVVDKFEGFDVQTDEAGNPYVKDHALARISCKIVEKLDLGTYMLYIGEATEAETLGEGPALTVDDFKNGGGSNVKVWGWAAPEAEVSVAGSVPSAAMWLRRRPCPRGINVPSAGPIGTNSSSCKRAGKRA